LDGNQAKFRCRARKYFLKIGIFFSKLFPKFGSGKNNQTKIFAGVSGFFYIFLNYLKGVAAMLQIGTFFGVIYERKKCKNFLFYFSSLIKVFILANVYIFNFSTY
jgi:hypothetical protein